MDLGFAVQLESQEYTTSKLGGKPVNQCIHISY